ncbi:MAG TPA: sigma-70 family RNA polymerase sigma factor [Bacteroidota bacterium]|nr:sigma-70 family RNA polymerase sigma factor [Bacteroidota bacterium]
MEPEARITDDSKLILALTLSDKGAYEKIFRNNYKVVYVQVLYRCRDRDLTDDIVQETFVRLWMRRASLNPELPLFPFLLAIAVNILRDHSRHAATVNRHRESAVASGEAVGRGPDEALIADLLQKQVSEIVNRDLSETDRSAFVLSRAAGLSNGEIADLLRIPLKSVENHLYHALKILRKKLESFQ